MTHHYTKPRGFGAMTPKEVAEIVKHTSVQIGPDKWIPARPIPFFSFKERLKQAWDVLTYRADALYWGE